MKTENTCDGLCSTGCIECENEDKCTKCDD